MKRQQDRSFALLVLMVVLIYWTVLLEKWGEFGALDDDVDDRVVQQPRIPRASTEDLLRKSLETEDAFEVVQSGEKSEDSDPVRTAFAIIDDAVGHETTTVSDERREAKWAVKTLRCTMSSLSRHERNQ